MGYIKDLIVEKENSIIYSSDKELDKLEKIWKSFIVKDKELTLDFEIKLRND